MALRMLPVDERCDTACPAWQAGECDEVCIVADDDVAFPSDDQPNGLDTWDF
jgi:hypothetical protein